MWVSFTYRTRTLHSGLLARTNTPLAITRPAFGLNSPQRNNLAIDKRSTCLRNAPLCKNPQHDHCVSQILFECPSARYPNHQRNADDTGAGFFGVFLADKSTKRISLQSVLLSATPNLELTPAASPTAQSYTISAASKHHENVLSKQERRALNIPVRRRVFLIRTRYSSKRTVVSYSLSNLMSLDQIPLKVPSPLATTTPAKSTPPHGQAPQPRPSPWQSPSTHVATSPPLHLRKHTQLDKKLQVHFL